MKKIAVFVEGQTELIFVKNLLLTIYTYNVDIVCYKLRKDGNSSSTNYDFKCEAANIHYQLIDVGNDEAVLQRIIDREKSLLGAGYSAIIGLRDMYGNSYCSISKAIDISVIQKFISVSKQTILDKAMSPDKIKFCFAIMEIEAWFIKLTPFLKLHPNLKMELINKIIGCDFETMDSERVFFRPSVTLKSIFSSVDLDYDKSEKSIESLCSFLTEEDYIRLKDAAECASFTYFYNKLITA